MGSNNSVWNRGLSLGMVRFYFLLVLRGWWFVCLGGCRGFRVGRVRYCVRK